MFDVPLPTRSTRTMIARNPLPLFEIARGLRPLPTVLIASLAQQAQPVVWCGVVWCGVVWHQGAADL